MKLVVTVKTSVQIQISAHVTQMLIVVRVMNTQRTKIAIVIRERCVALEIFIERIKNVNVISIQLNAVKVIPG